MKIIVSTTQIQDENEILSSEALVGTAEGCWVRNEHYSTSGKSRTKQKNKVKLRRLERQGNQSMVSLQGRRL